TPSSRASAAGPSTLSSRGSPWTTSWIRSRGSWPRGAISGEWPAASRTGRRPPRSIRHDMHRPGRSVPTSSTLLRPTTGPRPLPQPMPDDYQASLDYLYGRLNYERTGMPRALGELRLGRLRRLLRRLGDPQDDLRIVHVGGTKGKGSTSVMLAAALSA